jgi:hypothetical protein
MARLARVGQLAADRRSFTVPALTGATSTDLGALSRRTALRHRAADPTRGVYIDAALADAGGAASDPDAFATPTCYRAAWLALVPNARLVRVVE